MDKEVNKELEEAYQNDSLNKTGIIDIENFPQDIPDKKTCEILDDLFFKNQLTSRQVKYCVLSNTSTHMTDVFDEYSYDGRKFIRYKATINQPDNITLSNDDTIKKDKFYWLEVKPIDLSKEKILFGESDEEENGRRM